MVKVELKISLVVVVMTFAGSGAWVWAQKVPDSEIEVRQPPKPGSKPPLRRPPLRRARRQTPRRQTPRRAKPRVRAAATSAAAEVTTSLPGEREFNQCIRIPKGKRIKVTLKPESELQDVVAWISSMTCKRFIVSSNLRSPKVTLISPTPVTASMAYRAFLSVLDVMGLTVVKAGGYLKVVQSNWALQSPIPTYGDNQREKVPHGDAIVTQIVRMRNVDANDLLLVLNKMKSKSGDITAYKAANSLIITDTGANVRRLLRLIRELDVEATGERVWVVGLKRADATSVAKTLEQVFSRKGRASVSAKRKSASPSDKKAASRSPADVGSVAVASKIVADETTNSVIIVASESAFSRIAGLIRRLDRTGEGVDQRIHVYHLENGDAEELATTLSSLTSGRQARTTRSRAGSRSRSSASAGTAALFEGDVKITADKSTNALVIVASGQDYLSIRRVIQKLDIPRRQVFIEAVILEVSKDNSRTLGLAAHAAKRVGSGSSESLLYGGLFPGGLNSLVFDPTALSGLAAGVRGSAIEGSATLLGLPAGSPDVPSFGVVLQALQTSNDFNVLSSPHILTTDNQEAEISVGQNLPFQGSFVPTGLAGQAGAAASLLPTVSVQRQDVALVLKITPHVNDSDMVRLELEQEVSDVLADNFGGAGLGPATSKRTVKTTVVVRDQQTIVIGGLMRDTIRDEETKIPILGDIPILGYLFKVKKKRTAKSNLLLILTPHVIRDQSDLRRIFKTKMDERREFVRRFTSFESTDVAHKINYRHKRGLLAEIHRLGLQVEDERRMLDEVKGRDRGNEVKPVPVDKPTAKNP